MMIIIIGEGKLTYADGDMYEGEWKDGKMEGHGTYYYADGDQYVGDWRDDKRHGYGKVVYCGQVSCMLGIFYIFIIRII